MKIGITANPHIPGALDSAKHVVARLEPAQEVVLESDLARVFGRNGMPLAHMKADVVLAIGGEGTIPRAPPLSPSEGLGGNTRTPPVLPQVSPPGSDDNHHPNSRGSHQGQERNAQQATLDG